MNSIDKYSTDSIVLSRYEFPTTTTTLAIDAEWCGKTFLTVQIAASDYSGQINQYYIFSDNEESLFYCPDTYNGIPVMKLIFPIGKKAVLTQFENLPQHLDILFFYSPRDIEGLIGVEEWMRLLIEGDVSHRTNLRIGTYNLTTVTKDETCKLYFNDLYGRFGTSLEKAYKAVGMDTTNGKDYIQLLNIDKTRMDLFRDNHPREFYEYSLGDLGLHELTLSLKDLMNDLLFECFDLKDVYRNYREYPASVGSLVSDIFLRVIHKQYPDVLRSCCLLSTTANSGKSKQLEQYREQILKGEDPYLVTKRIAKCKGIVHGIGMASIPAFFPGHYGLNDTSSFCAIIQGGRAIKEDPTDYLYEDVLDIDLQSAYGSSLESFDYPIGIPTIFSISNDRPEKVTLKEFLRLNSDELIPGNYVIYVSGKITHKQDLIFSKYGLTSNQIGGKIIRGHYDDTEDGIESRLGGKFLLTSQEIHLGIITSHILEVLEKVCSRKEYKEWMELEVQAAAYYPKSLEMSLEEWAQAHSTMEKIGINQPHGDARSRHWCRYPLRNFIGELLSRRLFYKAKRKENSIYECKQDRLKLLINTLYGDLASPYFAIGNTIVANNITTSVRCDAWKMSKALGTKITVTDGGLYTPNLVPYFREDVAQFHKPSLNTLFIKDVNYKRVVELRPLFEEDIQIILSREDAQDYIDSKALEHIKFFCDIYGLTFNFKIEHKIDNAGRLAVTNPFGKVDYIIYTYDGEEVVRVRGVKSKEHNIHPKVEHLRALANGTEVRFIGSELSKLVGVNEYIKNPHKFKDNLPGHELKFEYIHKPNKSGGVIFPTYKEFSKAEHAHLMRVSRYESKYRNVQLILKPAFLTK